MATSDTRIDDYINKSEAFAIPILKKIRALVQRAVPKYMKH
jgi:hypothetical protein